MNDALTKKRLLIFNIIIGVLLSVLIVRLTYLQIVKGELYKEKANSNIQRITYIRAPRGVIRDRNGSSIAFDVPRMNVCVVISEVSDMNILVKTIAPIIGYPPSRIRKILKKNEHNFNDKIVIKPGVETDEMMKLAEIQGDLPGLYLEMQPVREYPLKEMASHFLGYVGQINEQELESEKARGYNSQDYIGKDGIEKYYDYLLKGKSGVKVEMVDVTGRIIKVIDEKNSLPGKTLFLTIDLALQKKVEEVLNWDVKSLSKVSGEPLAACAVVMNVKNGEILALASVPGYDPNKFTKGISEKDYRILINRKDYPLLNRVVSGSYPAASTFKMITASAALQEGLCSVHSSFNCPGYYNVGGQRFNCFVRSGHGHINFPDSLGYSCDVVFYMLGRKLDIGGILKYARQFGLGNLTGIDLPGEVKGLLPDPEWKQRVYNEIWYAGDTVNLSIGQGFLGVTPIQMAVVTAAVANGGYIYKPHLLGRVETSDGKVLQSVSPVNLGRVDVDPKNLEAVRLGMRAAVIKGTAKAIKCRLTVAGKTGTAESFPCPENPHGRNHTWFVCFAPYEDPEIAVVIFFERSGGYGGSRAVPMAGEIISEYEKIYHPQLTPPAPPAEKPTSEKEGNKKESKEEKKKNGGD